MQRFFLGHVKFMLSCQMHTSTKPLLSRHVGLCVRVRSLSNVPDFIEKFVLQWCTEQGKIESDRTYRDYDSDFYSSNIGEKSLQLHLSYRNQILYT